MLPRKRKRLEHAIKSPRRVADHFQLINPVRNCISARVLADRAPRFDALRSPLGASGFLPPCRRYRAACRSIVLSFDLSVRVLAAVKAGVSHREAGVRLGGRPASLSRWRDYPMSGRGAVQDAVVPLGFAAGFGLRAASPAG